MAIDWFEYTFTARSNPVGNYDSRDILSTALAHGMQSKLWSCKSKHLPCRILLCLANWSDFRVLFVAQREYWMWCNSCTNDSMDIEPHSTHGTFVHRTMSYSYEQRICTSLMPMLLLLLESMYDYCVTLKTDVSIEWMCSVRSIFGTRVHIGDCKAIILIHSGAPFKLM